MLALLDAGVAMCVRAAGSRSSPCNSQAHPIVLPRHDLLCACACAVLDDGLVLVDPNRSELSMGGGTAVAHMPVALLPRSGRISLVTTDRTMPIEHFERALASATAGAKALDTALREQLRAHTDALARARDGRIFAFGAALPAAGLEGGPDAFAFVKLSDALPLE